MKILQIFSSADPVSGGPAELARQLTLSIQQLGHKVELLTLDEPSRPYISAIPAKTYALGPTRLGSYSYSPGLLSWLYENSRGYDAVIIHGIWQYSSFGTWRVLHKTTIPYFIFPHGMLDPWFKHRYPFKHIKKWLYWPWAEYRVLRDAKAVLFTSEQERILARKSFCFYKCQEEIAYCGITLPPQDNKCNLLFEKFPSLKDKRLFLFLGRIHPKKGCDLLIKAFARIASKDSSAHLIIAGPDQVGWQAYLEKLCCSLGVGEKVSWPGLLSGDLKWAAFYSADVFVLPSHQENFGIAVAEALGCGLPVLISDKVNIWQEISSSGAGFVAEDNIEGIEQLLERWLSVSDRDKNMMREKAKNCFMEYFDIRNSTQKLINIIYKYI